MSTKTISPSIEEYMVTYAPYFRRMEGKELAKNYVTGLIMEGERKSIEPMSERVNASERGMQRLLTEVKWDCDGVSKEYRQQMLSRTNDPQGVLIVDDTSFPKKGKHTVCVGHQYSGALGKVANCQVGVSLTYVGQGIAWPYAMDLYIPQRWDDDKDSECILKRKTTQMPDDAHYREKWEIALEQIDLAREEGVEHRAIAADAWYGNIPAFRKGLDDRNEKYVVGVCSDTEVFLEAPILTQAEPKVQKRGRPRKHPESFEANTPPIKLSILGTGIEEEGWEHLELRQDSKGKPLMVEAVSRRVWPAKGYHEGVVHEDVWLIIERRQNEKKGFELRYYFSNMPQTMPTIGLVRLSHERFWIEQGYQQLKEELGIDHHEGRSWVGWYRHVLLVFLAFGYLTLLRLQEKKQQEQAVWKKRILPKTILKK